MSYAVPVTDMRFVLEEVAQLGELARLPGYGAASPDLAEAVQPFTADALEPPYRELADVLGDVFGLDVGRAGEQARSTLWTRVHAAHLAWEAAGRP